MISRSHSHSSSYLSRFVQLLLLILFCFDINLHFTQNSKCHESNVLSHSMQSPPIAQQYTHPSLCFKVCAGLSMTLPLILQSPHHSPVFLPVALLFHAVFLPVARLLHAVFLPVARLFHAAVLPVALLLSVVSTAFTSIAFQSLSHSAPVSPTFAAFS